jgi:peptidoglycan/LPS O-acetylase OafA/YrhL
VSYGIHLTHGYVLFAVLRALGIRDAITFGTWQFFAFFVAVMVATTLLVTVMFVCLESPLIELGRRWGLWLPQTAIGGSE